MSAEVTYETNHTSTALYLSTISGALIFVYVFYCDLVKKKKSLPVKSVLLLFWIGEGTSRFLPIH